MLSNPNHIKRRATIYNKDKNTQQLCQHFNSVKRFEQVNEDFKNFFKVRRFQLSNKKGCDNFNQDILHLTDLLLKASLDKNTDFYKRSDYFQAPPIFSELSFDSHIDRLFLLYTQDNTVFSPRKIIKLTKSILGLANTKTYQKHLSNNGGTLLIYPIFWFRYLVSSTKNSAWNSLISLMTLKSSTYDLSFFFDGYLSNFALRIENDWGNYSNKNIFHSIVPIRLAILHSHLSKSEFSSTKDSSKLNRVFRALSSTTPQYFSTTEDLAWLQYAHYTLRIPQNQTLSRFPKLTNSQLTPSGQSHYHQRQKLRLGKGEFAIQDDSNKFKAIIDHYVPYSLQLTDTLILPWSLLCLSATCFFNTFRKPIYYTATIGLTFAMAPIAFIILAMIVGVSTSYIVFKEIFNVLLNTAKNLPEYLSNEVPVHVDALIDQSLHFFIFLQRSLSQILRQVFIDLPLQNPLGPHPYRMKRIVTNFNLDWQPLRDRKTKNHLFSHWKCITKESRQLMKREQESLILSQQHQESQQDIQNTEKLNKQQHIKKLNKVVVTIKSLREEIESIIRKTYIHKNRELIEELWVCNPKLSTLLTFEQPLQTLTQLKSTFEQFRAQLSLLKNKLPNNQCLDEISPKIEEIESAIQNFNSAKTTTETHLTLNA